MTPFEFLQEEYKNVQLALDETLRHDYGPDQSRDYHQECSERLARVARATNALDKADAQGTLLQIIELAKVSGWISLIERSHLGQFSWPFGDEIRAIAARTFSEIALNKTLLAPIVHVVSDGQGYQIINERQVPAAARGRRLVVVVFPRPLKHQVLMHAIFGHELGHTALTTTALGRELNTVSSHLLKSKQLSSDAAATEWLHSADAPTSIKSQLQEFERENAKTYVFVHTHRMKWLFELICDLIGMVLYGPAFLSAHKAIIQPLVPNPDLVDLVEQTHPPYSIRHKMLSQYMRLKGWASPVSNLPSEQVYLRSLTNDPFSSWCRIFDDEHLSHAIGDLEAMFKARGVQIYDPVAPGVLVELVSRISEGVPPVLDGLDENGSPNPVHVTTAQMLYAGWIFWEERKSIAPSGELSFLDVNRLCATAMIQQRAISLVQEQKQCLASGAG